MDISGLKNPLLPDPTQTQGTGLRTTTSSNLSTSSETTSSTASKQLSPLAQMAYSYQLTELSVNAEETKFAYRSSDNSLAVRAHSQTNFSLKQEQIQLSFTFSAEALGLSEKDFAANDGKPLQYSFSMHFSQTEVNLTQKAQLEKTQRKPEEIFGDILHKLSEIIRKPGDKKIALELDDEAVQTLMKDPEYRKLMKEVMGLVQVLNTLRSGQENAEQQKIKVSGKGQPYLNYEEDLSVSLRSALIDVQFTIMPPAKSSAEPPEPAQIEAEA